MILSFQLRSVLITSIQVTENGVTVTQISVLSAFEKLKVFLQH
jgi:hypothetical protein